MIGCTLCGGTGWLDTRRDGIDACRVCAMVAEAQYRLHVERSRVLAWARRLVGTGR